MSGPLLSVQDLFVRFGARGGELRRSHSNPVRAVDGVSFELHRGECLGLVGESGCGKSTLARAIVGLETAASGSIRLDGTELTGLTPQQWLPHRRRIQMIFQDPVGSMDPRRTIDWTLTEPMRVHGLRKPRERRLHALGLLDAVGLSPSFFNRYPFEFSGGQLQRIGIARALALEPELILCDEPVSSLDASVQAQVVNLLAELQERFELTYLFISHDLAVVRHLSNRVAVMYLGGLVEIAGRDDLYESPAHPYTRSLLASVPTLERRRQNGERRSNLRGEVPSASDPPPGCTFHTRCPERDQVPGDRCVTEVPLLEDTVDPSHRAACHLR